jgi:6-phosphogluconolactonase (cycloisomerase 2 family)
MKFFGSGIRALLRATCASARSSMVIGMHTVRAGFSALRSNFRQARVRVADQRPYLPRISRASQWECRAPLSFRNTFRLGATTLAAVALASCGGGGGGASTSNQTAPPPPAKYTIGGTVSGLTGSGLVLQNNGGDNLAVSASGAFTFATSISAGGTYAVTVMTQPAGQTCTVSSGSGTANANVTNVGVSCAASTVTVGGTVTGLTGTGLVLQDNGGDNLPVSGNGPFTFATAINSGAAYSVTVSAQPTAQTCTVTNGSGTATANITNVSVSCAASASGFTVGGTVAGLAGTGLVLQDNGGDNLAVSANGTFTFATPIAGGAAYAVTVATQPTGPAQRCIVSSGAGTAAANVTTVMVKCLTTGQFLYTANHTSGTVTGYSINPGTGVLTSVGPDQPDGVHPAAVSLAPNGKFAFSASDNGSKINAFTINPTTGALTVVAGSPFANAAFVVGHPYPDIAVDPQSKFLYLASQGDNLIVGFSIDPNTGALTLIGQIGAGTGAGGIPAFTPDGRFVYVVNQGTSTPAAPGDNSVSGYALDPTTGGLTPVPGSPFATGGVNPTWISFRPDGLFAYVSNSTNNTAGSVSVFSVNTTTGALAKVGTPVPVGNGPADLTIDSTGTHLYVPNRYSADISVFSIDATAGTLTPVGTGPAGAGPGPMLLVIEPMGKFAYAASSFGNDVWGYVINPDGSLTKQSTGPYLAGAAGSEPLFINIDPSGQFAYTANSVAGGIAAYTIDPNTGVLTGIPGTPFPTGTTPYVVSISPEAPGFRD